MVLRLDAETLAAIELAAIEAMGVAVRYGDLGTARDLLAFLELVNRLKMTGWLTEEDRRMLREAG